MIGTIFKKENRIITINKIHGNYPYLADISFFTGNQYGKAINQPLNKLAIKIFKEKYIIFSDISAEEKVKIFSYLLALVK